MPASLIPIAPRRYNRTMDTRAARELGSHLASDERLLWAGSPDRMRYALHGFGLTIAGLAGLACLVLVWWALVILIIAATLALELGAFLVLMLAVPALVVAGILAMRPIRRWSEARHVAYGLTDRRAVILVGGANSRIEDAAPSRFAERPLSHRHGNGTTTVLFISDTRSRGRLQPQSAHSAEPRGFIAVSHGEELLAHLDRMRAAEPTATGPQNHRGNVS